MASRNKLSKNTNQIREVADRNAVKYNVGDLIVFTDVAGPSEFIGKSYFTGIILSLNKDEYWLGGGYYLIHWEYPQHLANFKDDSKEISYTLLNDWVNECRAKVYPAMR